MDPKERPDALETTVTSSEAAELLGVSQRTVHYWIQRGMLKSWKTEGGHRRIPMSGITALLRKRQESLDAGGDEGITLLLVEDDAGLVAVFRKVAKKWPVRVRFFAAENGFDGLIQAGLHKPDLIITDLIMPSMDGFQMIASLRESPDLGGSRVVVVTALSDQEINSRGGLPEGVTVLQKPVSFERIEAIARSLV
ncbi:MAG: response regulator [Magnetococcales bacterium]|nr:response regulator [Magnetococcales bacterium]